MHLKIFVILLVIMSFFILQSGSCVQDTSHSIPTLGEDNFASNTRTYVDPNSGISRILIGSIGHKIKVRESSLDKTTVEDETLLLNATAEKKNKGILENIEQDICVIHIESMEELRKELNNSTRNQKLLLLKSGKYDGKIYIGNNTSNITIQPDPYNKGSVILDAMNEDYNIAIENTSNIYINNLNLKNGKNGILMESVKNCAIYNNKVLGFKFDGIFLKNCILNNSIKNNALNSHYYENDINGITLEASRDVLIRENEINVGYEYDSSSTTDNTYRDILLIDSGGNTIDFKGIGIISEDYANCAVACYEDKPMCSCESVNDDCQYFSELSSNNWSFRC